MCRVSAETVRSCPELNLQNYMAQEFAFIYPILLLELPLEVITSAYFNKAVGKDKTCMCILKYADSLPPLFL